MRIDYIKTELQRHAPFTVVGTATGIVIAAFLFVAVWMPCCTSDIVFPLLFTRAGVPGPSEPPARTAEARPDA